MPLAGLCRPVLVALVVSRAAAAFAQDPGSAVRSLADRHWAWSLHEDPLLATEAGIHDYDDRLGSVTPAALARRADSLRVFVAELERVNRDALGRQDRITADILELLWRDAEDELQRRVIRIPLNAEGGFYTEIAGLSESTPAATAQDLDRYAARLAAVPRYFREHVEWMREGLRTSYLPPQIVLQGLESTLHVGTPTAEQSIFFAPVRRMPNTVPDSARRRVAAAIARLITDSVAPAYRMLERFLVTEYRPKARATVGARSLPDGEAYYRERVRYFTTLPLDPDSVHALGLTEVARIRAEMDVARRRTGFRGTHPEFLRFLRTDPRFYPKTANELLFAASRIAKRIDHELPRLFRHLPRQPYGVVPVPAYLERKYTAGRYHGAPIESPRAGEYWVNLYDLKSRTLYTLEALTLHEAVPGHHLQSALAQELDSLPAFRRHVYFSAFGEGWGLYSERLGQELGFYTDPYSDFGRLTYEMSRACRLVVDTGIHWKGWTRQQAIDYLAANTALSLHEVTTEVDRYIGWPGQALAYKIGELELRRLRTEAERTLGAGFDVRGFHDVVLRNGSIPLPSLAREVRSWIAAGGQ